MSKLLALLLAILASLASVPVAAADPVYVMRHLPKDEGADPPLSAEGKAQAQALANMLAESGIKAVFATPTRRAVETGQPLAARLGIAVTHYDPGAPDMLVSAVTTVHGPVLIVGHSNTVGDIVARFGGAPAPVLGDQDYGTVFVVDPGTKSVRQIKLPAAR